MSPYLDTSMILSLLSEDSLSARARQFASRLRGPATISDLATAEFAAVVARRCRTGAYSREEAESLFTAFDQWRGTDTRSVSMEPADVARAAAWLRRLDLVLRALDALHLAIAARLGMPVVTFDLGMASAARALGLPLMVA